VALLGERRLRTRLAAAAAKASALCAVVALSATATGTPTGAAPEPPRTAGDDCSFQGAAAGEAPPTALIRTQHGQVREVPFSVGWDVYNGRRPGTLLAVCSDR
jgi:hypothetical protein